MLLNLTMLCIIVTSGLVALSLFYYHKRKQQTFRVHKIVLTIGISLVILFGFLLTPIFYFQLDDAMEISKWPSVDGNITSSKVVGGRAFRPDIQYEYVVDNKTYTGSSSLNSPGFGGRMNRLDAAEKLVKLYPPGQSITISYNPKNNAESTLNPHPTYAHYLKFGTSAFLLWIGMTIIFTYGWTKPKSKPMYKERT